MKPNDYVEIVVLPTVREFLQARDDRRLAYLSCIATYHVCDHVGAAECAASGQPIRDKLDTFCTLSLKIIRGLCNGSKHPGPRAFAPGAEKLAPVFAFDTPGAGFGEGRWNVPGLFVDQDGEKLFIDHCVQAVLLSLKTFYPHHLASVDLSGLDGYMIAMHAEALRRSPTHG